MCPLSSDLLLRADPLRRQAVQLAQALRPQVVLMDLEMPVLDGYEAARQIRACCPGWRVVALTVHDYEAAQRRAAQAGMEALIVKGSPVAELVAAIMEASAAGPA